MTLGELVSRLTSLPEYQAGKTHLPVTCARITRGKHNVSDVQSIEYGGLTGPDRQEIVLLVGGDEH